MPAYWKRYNVRLLGTPLDTIKTAEERSLFKKLLIDIGEPVPASTTVNSVEEAESFAEAIGLPLIVRPSYHPGRHGRWHCLHSWTS